MNRKSLNVRETIQFKILYFSFAILDIHILSFSPAGPTLSLFIEDRVHINSIDNIAFSSKFNHEYYKLIWFRLMVFWFIQRIFTNYQLLSMLCPVFCRINLTKLTQWMLFSVYVLVSCWHLTHSYCIRLSEMKTMSIKMSHKNS